MEWQSILASGAVALLSSLVTAVVAFHFDRQRHVAARRSDYANRLLDTFSRLNRYAETCAGRHGALADPVNLDRDETRRQASNDLHESWYASRDLDVLLPRAEPLTNELRAFLHAHANEARRQADGHDFDRERLKALGVLSGQVVDEADGWAADGGVVSVMVVGVEPAVKTSGS